MAHYAMLAPTMNLAYFIWKVPEKPVSARLGVETLESLANEVTQAVRSVAARGSEIGGILLGRVQAGTQTTVSVEAYVAVPCDYARGPLYRVSPADAERFAQAIQAQEKADDGLEVVGFFRSHTRPRLALDQEDIAFCKAQFGKPHQIALLIRPQRALPGLGGIFIWERGEMNGDASYLEFPTSRRELLPRCVPASDAAGAGAGAGEPRETWPGEAGPWQTKTSPVPAPPPKLSMAPVIQIVSRRKVPKYPSPVAAAPPDDPLSQEPEEEERQGEPVRIGRASTKIELRQTDNPSGRFRQHREVTRA